MFPFEIMSLVLLAGMAVSLVAGEAALYGDTLSLHINVSPKIVGAGFDGPTAEQIFIAESARIVQGASIIPAPTLRVSSNPTVVSALASPLRLEPLVGALQDQLGFERLVVNAAILSGAADSVRMLIVVAQPYRTQEQFQVMQNDGDLAELVRRGADVTMARISPYRVAQANYLRGLDNDRAAMTEAKATAVRYLARPWEPARATERAMLHNLLALVLALEGDVAAAENELRQVDPIPGVLPQARAVVALNRAFFAVAGKRPAEALSLAQAGRKLAASIALPDVGARVTVLDGLVAWSGGDTVQAEELFRAAIAALPDDDEAYSYLALLLAARGDQAGAAAERNAASSVHPFDVDIPGFAQSTFLVDPVNGGIKRHGGL
jgi:tetratricopeptide (TPR) repeat protein